MRQPYSILRIALLTFSSTEPRADAYDERSLATESIKMRDTRGDTRGAASSTNIDGCNDTHTYTHTHTHTHANPFEFHKSHKAHARRRRITAKCMSASECDTLRTVTGVPGGLRLSCDPLRCSPSSEDFSDCTMQRLATNTHKHTNTSTHICRAHLVQVVRGRLYRLWRDSGGLGGRARRESR